jgi:hypothetical protein
VPVLVEALPRRQHCRLREPEQEACQQQQRNRTRRGRDAHGEEKYSISQRRCEIPSHMCSGDTFAMFGAFNRPPAMRFEQTFVPVHKTLAVQFRIGAPLSDR